MRIAICDDDELSRSMLISHLNRYIAAHAEQEISYTAFAGSDELIFSLDTQNDFDVYILDILMPGTNGIDIGITLRRRNYDGIIIFLTSTQNYAVDSYDAKASAYLLKPIEQSKLFSVLEAAYAATIAKAKDSIIIKTKSGHIRLPMDNILYAETCRRVIVYHLLTGETQESTTLRVPFAQAMQTLLADNRFSLCAQGLVVNLSHITQIANDEVLFTGQQRAYFNKKTCIALRSLWTEYWANNNKK